MGPNKINTKNNAIKVEDIKKIIQAVGFSVFLTLSGCNDKTNNLEQINTYEKNTNKINLGFLGDGNSIIQLLQNKGINYYNIKDNLVYIDPLKK